MTTPIHRGAIEPYVPERLDNRSLTALHACLHDSVSYMYMIPTRILPRYALSMNIHKSLRVQPSIYPQSSWQNSTSLSLSANQDWISCSVAAFLTSIRIISTSTSVFPANNPLQCKAKHPLFKRAMPAKHLQRKVSPQLDITTRISKVTSPLVLPLEQTCNQHVIFS
jgi:hypothetical protein